MQCTALGTGALELCFARTPDSMSRSGNIWGRKWTNKCPQNSLFVSVLSVLNDRIESGSGLRRGDMGLSRIEFRYMYIILLFENA